MNTFLLVPMLLCAVFVAVDGGEASPLPPDADVALQAGIIAAKLPDYPLAIRKFQEARRLAPDAPGISYYLGLAESKINGRELRALCWLSAYLAARADDPDASAIRAEILALDVRSQSLIANHLKIMRTVAEEIPKADHHDLGGTFSNLRDDALAMVAVLKARSGDVEGAGQDAERILYLPTKARAQAAIGRALALAGDRTGARTSFAAARDSAVAISRPDLRADSESLIAGAQAEAGEIVAALRTAEAIQYPAARTAALALIAKQQATIGEVAAALATAESIEVFADRLDAQASIARTQAEAGDRDGASTTLTLARTTQANVRYNSESGPGWRNRGPFPATVVARAIGRDGKVVFPPPAEPVNVADLNSRERSIGAQQEDLFIAQGVIGEFDRQIANTYAMMPGANVVLRELARARAKAGDFPGAQQVIDFAFAQEQRLGYGTSFLMQVDLAVAKARSPTADPVVARQQLRSLAQATESLRDGDTKTAAQKAIAEAIDGQSATRAWIALIDQQLSTPVFLDIAGHLKSQSRDSLWDAVYGLQGTIQALVDARDAINDLRRRHSSP